LDSKQERKRNEVWEEGKKVNSLGEGERGSERKRERDTKIR
jgi:hypothetical protein